ncbi:UNKNOWN [Stylonychia lemnae]|uniref:Uncharacterized protein n=1 Tax=Stylonychia lemnae TaxID=5949 RepID=A0A078AXE7_STYLE|nr:UNKNOWN [Stylonychia lemnae]|eukprot:CDW85897.1 UNKNOWN [Stylonychia lemnae]
MDNFQLQNLAKDIKGIEIKLVEYSIQRNNLQDLKKQLETKLTRIQYGEVTHQGQQVAKQDNFFDQTEVMRNQAREIVRLDKQQEEGRNAVQAIHYEKNKEADDLVEQMRKKKNNQNQPPANQSSNQNQNNFVQNQNSINQQNSYPPVGVYPYNYQVHDPPQDPNYGHNVAPLPMMNINGGVPVNVNVTVNQNGQPINLV